MRLRVQGTLVACVQTALAKILGTLKKYMSVNCDATGTCNAAMATTDVFRLLIKPVIGLGLPLVPLIN